jgi:uncharacterized membrane protein
MMLASITFELPLALLVLLPVFGLVGAVAWRQRRRGLAPARIAAMSGLRLGCLVPLVVLAARPVWIATGLAAAGSRPVMLLVDRSESMSLADDKLPRYDETLRFLSSRLLPALKLAHLPVRAMAFAERAEAADGQKLSSLKPNGKRTNLGGAIAQALDNSTDTPLALIALTDGSANETRDNARAVTALVDARVPFIGVGFGSDQGVRTLSLRQMTAPATVGTHSTFSIAAELELMNIEDLPAFDLLLYRDGEVVQKRSVTPGKGSRMWVENFQVSEQEEGVHNYLVQVLPPNLPNLKCVNLQAGASVRVSDEKELRVLYIQGALTWDYKFISLALRNDPTIKLTGLTRTSRQSVFRQNVENTGEFLNGFPTTLRELAPFRAVVLSNLRPADLTAEQQELLARFCGELGGGVLMVGGAATFDGSWQHSRLEQLLPVVFSADSGVQGLDRPFRLHLTPEALAQPLFQISDSQPAAQAWAQLPTFSQYGRVEAAKAGAQVWMVHPTDDGPRGRRILMASQRYGAGLSAVLTVQNFWRWRLAKDCDPQQFDRFWRQLFRMLGDAGRQDVAIHLADQQLQPGMDVQVLIERQPNPKNVLAANRKFLVRIENGRKELLQEEAVELEPLHPVPIKFHAEKPDTYNVTVTDPLRVPLCSRPIEIRDVNVEFQDTARNMEALRQWAGVSDGLAFKVEECPAATDLVAQIKTKVEEVRRRAEVRHALGLNGWMLTWVLGCMGGEWLLRKRWDLI